MATKKLPAIRFKGFEGEWGEKRLGDIGSVAMNKRIFKHQTDDKGEIPFYKIGTFGDRPDAFISKSLFDVYKSKYPYPVKGDVLISAAGSIGKTVEYLGADEYFQDSNIVWLKHDRNAVLNEYLKNFYSVVKWDGLEGSTIKRLYNSNILRTIILLPELSEQTQIGNYFKELDGLIGLQEQKLEKVTSLKKAMLEKMFPKAGADVPEIRFKGFVGKWERVKLGDMFDFSLSTNTLSRALLVDKMGVVKNIHYGDILIKYSSCLNVGEENIPFVKDADIIDFKNSFLRDGDVIFADAAEDEAVGKATELYNVTSDYIVSGLHTIVARPLLKFKKYYLGYFLNSDSYHNQLTALMQGTKVLSISKNGLKKTTLLYPSNEIEQQKIGEYFKNLDELISQSKQKIKQLKNLKQAMLQKMFI